ncbi:hypothetical protein X777_05215, partial [Ooceraea biroi]
MAELRRVEIEKSAHDPNQDIYSIGFFDSKEIVHKELIPQINRFFKFDLNTKSKGLDRFCTIMHQRTNIRLKGITVFEHTPQQLSDLRYDIIQDIQQTLTVILEAIPKAKYSDWSEN